MITPAQAAEGGSFPAHKRWKIVFVNHVTTNPFFVPTQYGIQDATALLGMDYQWTGSANADIGEMVNAVNAAIAGESRRNRSTDRRPQGVRQAHPGRARRRHSRVRL